jgi:hypothetical protein
MEKLTESEFKEMLNLLQRYVTTDMDQFEHWKFDSQKGTVYVELARAPLGGEKG